MTLQEKTIQRYRQLYPNDTLKKISGRTGIQLTRVFRLFNGRTMKVVELEALENVINANVVKKPAYDQLSLLLDEASTVLTHEEFEKVSEYIKRKVSVRAYARQHPTFNHKNAIIA